MMHRRFLFAVPVALAAIVSLAACRSNTSPGPLPTLGPTCTLPSGTQTVLVYPAPGSAGVSDANGEIVIGSTTALPVGQSGNDWDIWFSDAVTGGALTPLNPGSALASASPPFPAPNATPSFPNPQYQQQTSGVPFAAGQTVTVYVNNKASGNNCTPLQIGQFGT
ncbi:MAG TPA: hypothetical protein VJP76_00905 [Candidatus Tumulicola sp.]|nr:hypothetical protein [Candidatus Tumulicola sp.]